MTRPHAHHQISAVAFYHGSDLVANHTQSEKPYTRKNSETSIDSSPSICHAEHVHESHQKFARTVQATILKSWRGSLGFFEQLCKGNMLLERHVKICEKP